MIKHKFKVFLEKCGIIHQPAHDNIVDYHRSRGVIIGKNVDIIDSYLDGCHGALITIGDNVTITGARILTHDASTKKFLGYSKIGLVTIGNNVFIGNGAIILPSTSIGDNVIIGAGTVVANDIPSNSVVAGNPAKILCTTSEYLKRNKERMASKDTYVSNQLFCERSKNDWSTLKKMLREHKYGFDL